MDAAINEWSAGQDAASASALAFLKKVRKSFVRYGDMIVLPSTAFPSEAWNNQSGTEHGDLHLAIGVPTPTALKDLYGIILRHLKATHIATTRPIPLNAPEAQNQQDWNRIRAPLNFTPLYGDFGPSTCSSPPTPQDFDQAFWTTAKQNGIVQTWAPRWTMFSRGNISEKARLLTLPSVLQAVEEGRRGGEGSCAVDLFVGIGYFGFSYLEAGVDRVMGWDINPWSIEGAVRGAKANGWTAQRFRARDNVDGLVDQTRFVVFEEDNVNAIRRFEEIRRVCGEEALPPVRHVNCGLLPSSRGCWMTAVELLCEELGGWLHVHENFAVEEISCKAEEVRMEIARLCDEVAKQRHGSVGDERKVTIEAINRLKSYAPGVMHVVIDIHISSYVPD